MKITKYRKIWFSISCGLIILSCSLTGIFGLNFGLDFLGGIRWDVAFEKTDTSLEQIQDFFTNEKFEYLTKDPLIQNSGNGEFLITIENISEENFQNLADNFREKISNFEEKSYYRVDPSIGKSFKTKAIWALIFSLIGIVLFVAYAFRKIPASVSPWRFGASAIFALFHDVMIIVGVFALLGYLIDTELTLQFITALLATLGFSVNDTIIILDRVRENLTKQKSTQKFADIVELSIKQTLRRSLNTSISTLLPLLGLLIFGAETIFFFILALFIGIIVGTYSSIFLVSPMLVLWKEAIDKKA